METIILVSGSPRRRELLSKARIPIRIIPPDVDESFSEDEDVKAVVSRLSKAKVETIISVFKNESPRWVLGVDTLVELDGRVIGKPKSMEEAREVIESLSGRIHRVVSGLTFLKTKNDQPITRVSVTEVKFKEMSPDEVSFYVNTGEWSGVAGGYRIQGAGSFFIEWIKGSYSNVMGLPLETFYGILRESGYSFE